MRTRLLLNLGLLVLVGTLVLIAVYEPGHAPPPVHRVTDIDPASIRHVVLQRPKRPDIDLVRKGGRWQMRAPYVAAANGYRVEALLGLLSAASLGGFRPEGNDLSQFGLQPPVARLQADDAELLLGNTEPIDGRRYVLYGDEVHLVTDVWFNHLAAPAGAYVDPAPLAGAPAPVGFELPGLTLTRHGGRWRVEPPGAARGADAPNALADAWREAQATQVRAFDPARHWAGTVKVHLGAGGGKHETIEFAVAHTAGGLVLGRRDLGLEYHLGRHAAARLLTLRRVQAPG